MTTTVEEHTQTLADFRAAVAETVDRVHQTGEPEMITVDGEVRGVLVPPAMYEALLEEEQLARDVAAMRRALEQHERGESRPAAEFFDELRAKLLAMKAAQEAAA